MPRAAHRKISVISSAYTYTAYASDLIGTDFTLINDPILEYTAVLYTVVPIPLPVLLDFDGLWYKRIGTQGPQGAQGAQGIGVQGPQGAQGIGTQGPQGAQGIGAQGPQGTQGPQGAQGAGTGAEYSFIDTEDIQWVIDPVLKIVKAYTVGITGTFQDLNNNTISYRHGLIIGDGAPRYLLTVNSGTIIGADPCIPVIALYGAGTKEANGGYCDNGSSNGKNSYMKNGYIIFWQVQTDVSAWVIRNDVDGNIYLYYSTEDVATPDLVTTWNIGTFGTIFIYDCVGILPVPTINII